METKQRMIEIWMCFEEQFIKGEIKNLQLYYRMMDYCDYLYENYEKMGILKD